MSDDLRERIARAIEARAGVIVDDDTGPPPSLIDRLAKQRGLREAARIARDRSAVPDSWPPVPIVRYVDDPADPRIPDLWPDDLAARGRSDA